MTSHDAARRTRSAKQRPGRDPAMFQSRLLNTALKLLAAAALSRALREPTN
jgi:hypothetical protein